MCLTNMFDQQKAMAIGVMETHCQLGDGWGGVLLFYHIWEGVIVSFTRLFQVGLPLPPVQLDRWALVAPDGEGETLPG